MSSDFNSTGGQQRNDEIRRLMAWYRRLELGDAILFVYFIAFIRQYAWSINHQRLAWTATICVSAAGIYLWVRCKENLNSGASVHFWLLVALPLFIVYAMRVAFPDISFDVLNYHILHGERALRGPLFMPGDFFPSAAPFNPVTDIITGIFRHLLGYRLGTIVNYLALLWCGTILDKVLRDYLKNGWLRGAGVLMILFTEHILFEVNNYMVDLLALPMLLEATRLAISSGSRIKELRRCILIGALLGASLAFKISNVAAAIPIALVYLYLTYDAVTDRVVRTTKLIGVMSLSALLPLLPFSVYLYRETGSPIFPLYNGIFRSPYWPISNVFDVRWGPRGLWETIVWPVLVFWKPERLNEFANYSGRLSFSFILAVLCLLLSRDKTIRALSFITVIGLFIWSAGSGYIRYALYFEIVGGLLVLWLIYLFSNRAFHGSRKQWRLVIVGALCVSLLAQVRLSGLYVYRFEWSQRPSIFTDYERFINDAKYFLKDRSLQAFLSENDRQLIAPVEVWLETEYKTSSLESLLKPNTPILGVRMPEFFSSAAGRNKFRAAVRELKGKRIFTLASADKVAASRRVLAERGFDVVNINPLKIPFYSDETSLNMLLVEVAPPGQQVSSPTVGLPMADSAFDANISVGNSAIILHAGQKTTVKVTIENTSSVWWPGQQQGWEYQITLGNRWFDNKGNKLNDLDGRVAVLNSLVPGASMELPLTVTAPAQAGEYVLEIDAIQEGVAWFSDRGSTPLRLSVKVEP